MQLIKMIRASNLNSYVKVKEYIAKNNVTLMDLYDSVDKGSIHLKVTADCVTKELYTLADAARYMAVSSATMSYANARKNETIRRRKGGVKVFYIDWCE